MTGRPVILLGVFGLLHLLPDASPVPAQSVAEAEQVMAALVSRFPQFVEWPSTAFEHRETVDICVWGPDRFGSVLEQLIESEELNGRRLNVRPVSHADMLDGCHVLFLSASTRGTGPLLARLDGVPMLTIGESADFLDDGGIINLLIVGRRVRFEVNAEAAERAGLRLSSQLLGLAIDVRRPT